MPTNKIARTLDLYNIFKWQIIPNWIVLVHYLIHGRFYSLGKIRTSSPGPGMVWLCPPQPFSMPVHASGRDHFKADSGTEVEATKQKENSKVTVKIWFTIITFKFYPYFRILTIFLPLKVSCLLIFYNLLKIILSV